MVRLFLWMARPIAWWIHHFAYVENRYPRVWSNFCTAVSSPRLPSAIRSASGIVEDRYRLAIMTTNRRFASAIASAARFASRRSSSVAPSRLPDATRRPRSTSCSAVSNRCRPISRR